MIHLHTIPMVYTVLANKDTTRVFTSLYLDREQRDALKLLSKASGVPLAALLREAIRDLLVKRGDSIDARLPPVRVRRPARKPK
jgi:hypothetical protein